MTSSPGTPVVVVGRGRLGRVLAARLREAGIHALLVRGRGSVAEARLVRSARLVWLAVPDPALPAVADRVASHLVKLPPRARRPAVVHASGASPPEVLAPCREAGAPIAAAHPLVSFGTARTELRGATVVIDGDDRAVRAAASAVRTLGARPLLCAIHGPRYHAAAALVANGSAALAALAVGALAREGLSEQVAARAVGALLRSVADNVLRVGPVRALTGPIARGDAAAVARHLAALKGPARADYRAVSRLVLRAAEAAGLEATRATVLHALLEEPRRNARPRVSE